VNGSDVANDPSPFDRWLHDVKNQLSIILGFSEILLQELEGGDARRPDLQEIHTAAERALDAMSRAPRPVGDGNR
jgi:signal transduction histidine kinase